MYRGTDEVYINIYVNRDKTRRLNKLYHIFDIYIVNLIHSIKFYNVCMINLYLQNKNLFRHIHTSYDIYKTKVILTNLKT